MLLNKNILTISKTHAQTGACKGLRFNKVLLFSSAHATG